MAGGLDTGHLPFHYTPLHSLLLPCASPTRPQHSLPVLLHSTPPNTPTHYTTLTVTTPSSLPHSLTCSHPTSFTSTFAITRPALLPFFPHLPSPHHRHHHFTFSPSYSSSHHIASFIPFHAADVIPFAYIDPCLFHSSCRLFIST
ncbi:hypothetical protein Pcinc_013549 [Petrolisthes cinctipes]|uniref:Uncharacterized protein n=1 Tax=Petrolisthes cinctipes TaxID=88211 RepID=A0AAE1KQ91_PETCI|nr:hypothetical protein Pcinc_013549 [Petrolisthes cinctipes]